MDFNQEEVLTTRIRGLLEEYPVGTGILKEALQNSDDSGAKIQIFLLDRMTYPLTNLYDPNLKRYQGPSLILQNNNLFKESDFVSLKSLGESGKRKDVAKTGKFGLGFNSVYNLTDTPMILTGDQLVVLDPHKEIRNFSGGFRETFTHRRVPPNQLKPFGESVSFETPFDGTIIRLPLRTREDAARSMISNKEVTPDSIMEILEAFKSEAVESLLFLKNVEKIEVYERSSSNARKLLYSAEILDAAAIRDARSELVKALHSCTAQSNIELSCTIEMKIAITDYNNSNNCETHWLVRHEVNNGLMTSIDEKFLREQKLLPWVGLAASLDFDKPFSGRLFTFLPLPIITSLPVHIHGIFGLTRDRRNLIQQCADHPKDSKPDIIGKWNKELFQILIPAIWARLLVDLTKWYNGKDQLPYWPSPTIELQKDIFKDLLANILLRVQEDRLAVFQKHCLSSEQVSAPKWLSLKDDNALVCPQGSIAQILADAGMQIIGVNQEILQTLRSKKIPFSEPNSSVVRQHLRNTSVPWTSVLSAPSKKKLLEYVCHDKNFADLIGLELIPLANNEFTTFATSKQTQQFIYLIDSENELDLFQDWSHRLIVGHKVFLDNMKHFKKHTNVQHWSFDAALQYLHDTFFKSYSSSEDEIPGSAISVEYLNKLWPWIDSKLKHSNAKLNSLWLIPTVQGKLRKINVCPAVISKGTVISAELYSVIVDLLDTIDAPFFHEDFIESPSGYLKSFGFIRDLNDISNIFDLLEKKSWINVSKNEASALREYFYHCLIAHPNKLTNNAKTTLRKLPIFELLVAPEFGSYEFVQLSNLVVNATCKIIAISSNYVIPKLDNILFVHIPDPSSEYLVHKILGIEKRSFNDFLLQFVVPYLRQQPEHLLDALMKMLLSNLNKIPREQKSFLCRFPFVRCSSESNTSYFHRREPSELVDPSYIGLTKLFLPQESIFPVGYYADIISQLQSLGMITRLNSSLIKSRINYFVKMWNDEPTSNILKDIHKISLHLLTEIDKSDEPSILRDLQRDIAWLPATTRSGELKLVRSSECRDQRDKDLISHALPVVQYTLRNLKLIESLGWNKDVSVDVLQKQIIGIIDELQWTGDIASGNMLLPVFDCLEKLILNNRSEQLNHLKNALHNRAWIPVKGKLKHISETIFQESDFSLEPYATPLPPELRNCASQFLKYMGVKHSADSEHMIEILKKISIGLGKADTLNKEAFKLAVRIIETLSYDDKLSPDLRRQILIPNAECRLTSISDLTYHDLQSKTNVDGEKSDYGPIANEAISISVAKNLKIPLLSERILYDIMDDDYIEEHEQKESLCTRIRNTLHEYTIESTSNEFIANADDSGATRFRWVYDPYGEYSTELLFCNEMAEWQGPSIFCYNDGLFTEKDIKALGKVGVGSKQEDSTKIGRYGLGFLSAYHWTDIPSVVSGNSAIFFDPQQKFLPRKRNFERLGGLHIKNVGKSKASEFSDQFAPFTGLFGFNPKKHFKGTLFRFPLRNKKQANESDIAANNGYLGEPEVKKLLDEFFKSARQSLFFLHNIKEIEAFILTKDRKLKPLWSVSLEETSSDTRKTITKESCNMILDICIKKFIHDSLGIQMASNITERWAIFSELFQIEQSLKNFAEINRMVPHIGIAAHLWTKSIYGKPTAPSLGLDLFCILSPLPMPVCVGLPVHLYGCFALSSDRRSILMDTPNESDKTKISWNGILLQHTAILYLHALAELAKLSDRKGIYYDYWPSSTGNTLIQPLHVEFWKVIEKHDVFETCSTISPQWLSIGRAIFDNAEDIKSRTFIGKILQRGGSHNLVSLPPKLWNILRNSSNKNRMRLVDPAFMRKVTKGPIIKEMLVSNDLSNDQYLSLLDYLVLDNGLKDMLDCQILLLENGNVAKLMNMSMSTAEKYYLASMQEQELFDFAKEHFISRNVPKKFIDLLSPSSSSFPYMNLGLNFNVSIITSSAIKFLLRKIIPNPQISEYNPVGTQKPNGIWIKAFWKYWDEKAISPKELEDIPIIPAGNPPTHLVSVKYLSDSCLLAPPNDNLRRVIEKIGRVRLVDHALLPTKSLQNQIQVFGLEKYLDCLASTSSPTDIFADLSYDDNIILRNFVMGAVDFTDFKRMKPQSKALLANLRLWHVWPENSINLVSAKNTILLRNNIFFKELPNIVFLREEPKYFSMLEYLGSRRYSNEENLKNYIMPTIPKLLAHGDIDRYHTFLRNLLQLEDLEEVLTTARIVPDVNGAFHQANELLDYDVHLFKHTFILDGKDKLLHDRFTDLRINLHKIGLRHKLDGENFIKCAKEINRIYHRNPSNGIFNQAIEVFKYLNSTNILYTDDEWEQLSTIHFIPTRPSSSKPFFGSGDFGTDSSTYPRLSCVRNLITQEMSNIAWTQRPIFNIAPSRSLLQRWKAITYPDATCVFKHLCCLAKIRKEYADDPVSFLNDLKATYAFLEIKYNSLDRQLLNRITSTKVFLNYDIEKGNSSDLLNDGFWRCASELVLNTDYDLSNKVYRICSSLDPYRNLLEMAGAKHIKSRKRSPIINDEEDEAQEDEEDAYHYQRTMFNTFYKFYQKGIMTDAEFLVKSKTIRGHRCILAAASDYFLNLFTGPMVERNSNIKIEIRDLTPRAVQHAFEFIYLGRLNKLLLKNIPQSVSDIQYQISDDNPDSNLYAYLLELLQVADRFLLDHMRNLVQKAIIQAELVRIDTVRNLIENAKDYNAEKLLDFCVDFEKMNSELVAMVNEEREE